MQEQRWTETTKRWVAAGSLILIALAIYRFQRILVPVVVALVLAYVLYPIVNFLQNRLRLPRTLAVLVSFLIVLALVAILPVLIVPIIVQQVQQVQVNLQEIADFIVSFFERTITIGDYSVDLSQFYEQILTSIESSISSLIGTSVNLALSVVSGVGWAIVVIIVAFWLVRDAPIIRRKVEQLAPLTYRRDLRRLGQEIFRVWGRFFRGQLLIGFVLGSAVAIIMMIIGLPNALLMGLIAGVLELIPTIGQIIAAVPPVLIALTSGSSYLPLSHFWFAVLVLGLYIAIQNVEGNVLIPRIMGSTLRLHPLVVLLGVILGAELAGIVGIFLAAPMIATLRVLARYVYRRLLDLDPFPEEEAAPEKAFVPPVGGLNKEAAQVILFDLDGTLIDTDDSLIKTWAQRLRWVDWLFPDRKPEVFLRHLLMSTEGSVNQALILLDKIGLDRILFGLRDRWYRIRRKERPKYLPVERAQETLDALHRQYRLGIVTTRGRDETMAFLQQIERADLFEVVITRNDVNRLKPHPEPVRKACRALGVPCEACVLVGDTALDVRSAKAAGAQAVGVLCGLGMMDDLEQADLILAHTNDLPAHLLD